MLSLELVQTSSFNRRFRVTLGDGAQVEAVHYRGDNLCVSSQVGCAVGCPFCASGRGGLARGLSQAELVGQVDAVQAHGLSVRRVTVSGVGEPLHNLEAVLAFIEVCRARGIGPSLTTSGGPLAKLRVALHAPHNGLTLSVHAGLPATRARLVPRGPALDELFACLAEELPRLSRSRRKKTALAYLAMAGENDSDEELSAFIERALPTGLSVHLYALNPVPGQAGRALRRARYEQLYQRLVGAGLTARMSSQARIEANGGCGTLLAEQLTARRPALLDPSRARTGPAAKPARTARS